MNQTKFMTKKKNKGFTLVEMVIVIAVIAILTAVLVPTFIGISNKAKVSADIQTAKNASTIASAVLGDSVEDYEIDMQEVYDLVANGKDKIDLAKKRTAGRLALELETRQIVVVNEDMKVVGNENVENATNKNFWFFIKDNKAIVDAKKVNATTSVNYFLCEDSYDNFDIKTLSSFETGNSVLNGNLTISSQNTTSVNEYITVGGDFKGTTTLDVPNATVEQEGSAKNLDCKAVANNSLHINGVVETLTLTKGKVEVNPEAFVTTIEIATPSTEAVEPQIINKGVISKVQKKGATEEKPNNTEIKDVVVTNQGGLLITAPTTGITQNGTNTSDGKVMNIGSYNALTVFRDAVNAGQTFEGITVRMTKDITLEDGWLPIGAFNRKAYNIIGGEASFSGIFDGTDHKILNLNNKDFDVSKYEKMWNENASTVAGKKEFAYGLFGVVTNATIKNLKVEKPNIICNINDAIYYGDSVGAVVGFSSGKLLLENVQVIGGNIEGFDAVGGIIGRSYHASTSTDGVVIRNCATSAVVKGAARASGLLGYATDFAKDHVIDIVNCVFGEKTANGFAGSAKAIVVKSNIAGIYNDYQILSGIADINSDAKFITITNCQGKIEANFEGELNHKTDVNGIDTKPVEEPSAFIGIPSIEESLQKQNNQLTVVLNKGVFKPEPETTPEVTEQQAN